MQNLNNNFEQDGFGSFWFWLAVVANYCQIESYSLNKKQISNDEIAKLLLEQDKILDEQTNVYLKRIVEQNEEILRYLRKES